MKLVDLARESVRILKEIYPQGIKSEALARELNVPKRRVYDIIAVLKGLDLIETERRYDGTTLTWIDRSQNFVDRTEYEDIREQLSAMRESRNELQVQVAELKEQLRHAKSKIRLDIKPVEAKTRTEFNTKQLTIRPITPKGFKKVQNAGVEVIIETYDPGIIVDPTEKEEDGHAILLKTIQKI